MVAQLLDLPIMVPDPGIQLFHEEAMFLTIVHRSEDEGGKTAVTTVITEVKQIFCFKKKIVWSGLTNTYREREDGVHVDQRSPVQH